MAERLQEALARTFGAGARHRGPAIVALIAALVIAAALAAVPLREAIARKRDDVARSRLMLDVARARSAENATLGRVSVPAKSGELRAALDRALTAQGLRYVPVDAQSSDDTQRIVIEAAPFDTLARALDALAREGGVRVTEAILTARVDPGTVRAELALSR